jgi:hypothetical protein
MSVLLMQTAAGAGFSSITTTRIEPGARFTIADVPPGQYVLIVRREPFARGPARL